jgi:predicted ATPase/DNA-binding SARP family transcriptional activator
VLPGVESGLRARRIAVVNAEPSPVEPSGPIGCGFRILGPLEITRDGIAVGLPPPRAQHVLIVLLLDANRVVSVDRLCDELWQEHPPDSARAALHVHIATLRRALGPGARLHTRSPGYVLELDDGQLDARRFEDELGAARDAHAAGKLGGDEQLRHALAIWRGPALAEFGALPCALAEAARLDELRLDGLETRIDADLALARHGELVAELQRLTAAHPYRERLHGQLVLALYRAGRQADALSAYHHARSILVEELGIEPGTELRDLQRAILAHDPGLDASHTKTAANGPNLRRSPLGARRDRSLPAPPNRTIGRRRELREIRERLRAGVRLLTLTGPGGVGKTRLALEAASAIEADFEHDARFVSLAALHRPQEVPAAIVTTLGITVLSGESPNQAVRRFLGTKHLLLVADNFEHLLGAAPFVGELLEACPALTVLATSREPLALHAEERYLVPPLALPLPGTPRDVVALAGVDAVALFAERARAHDPDFRLDDANAAAVAEICRRLDGLPLAIELASARCGLLSPGEIAERLDTALSALGAGARDAPARQQTLRATIDWSHDLLSDAEKRCFARFAVFAGGATVEAAETITASSLDTLDRLVAKSLLVRRQHAFAVTRLGMLETIRAYATERFAATADRDAVREHHYRFYLTLAQRHGTERAVMGTGRQEHLARLDAEIDNLHGALAWAVGRHVAEPALALCAAVGEYWRMRDRYADAVEWIDQAVAMPDADTHPAIRVCVLCIKARAIWQLGREAEQPAILAEAENLARALAEPLILSHTLLLRAAFEPDARLDVADAFADEALDLAMAAEDDWTIARALFAKAIAAPTIAELRERVDRAAEALHAVGNVHQLAHLFAGISYRALLLGSDGDAKEFVDRAIPLACGLDNLYLWMMLRGNFGLSALLTGDTAAANQAFREELGLCRELVVLPFASEGLLGLATVAAVRGDDHRAARLSGAASAHRYGGPKEDPVAARLDAAFLEAARTRHGADAWDAAARQGATMSFEDAIAYALEETRQ